MNILGVFPQSVLAAERYTFGKLNYLGGDHIFKYYKLTKHLHNNNLQLGLIFSYSQGKTLDRYAEVMCSMKRKRFLFIREPDIMFKARIIENHLNNWRLQND